MSRLNDYLGEIEEMARDHADTPGTPSEEALAATVGLVPEIRAEVKRLREERDSARDKDDAARYVMEAIDTQVRAGNLDARSAISDARLCHSDPDEYRSRLTATEQESKERLDLISAMYYAAGTYPEGGCELEAVRMLRQERDALAKKVELAENDLALLVSKLKREDSKRWWTLCDSDVLAEPHFIKRRRLQALLAPTGEPEETPCFYCEGEQHDGVQCKHCRRVHQVRPTEEPEEGLVWKCCSRPAHGPHRHSCTNFRREPEDAEEGEG